MNAKVKLRPDGRVIEVEHHELGRIEGYGPWTCWTLRTADALQALMQAGNKRFCRVEPVEGKIVFIQEDKRLSLVITTDKFHSVDEVLAAPDEQVFSSIEVG